jgi:hypothetical protein
LNPAVTACGRRWEIRTTHSRPFSVEHSVKPYTDFLTEHTPLATYMTVVATVISGHNARRQSRQSDAKWSPCASGDKPDPRLHNARTVADIISVSVLTSRDMGCIAVGGVASSEVSTKLDLSLGPARPSPGLDCCFGSRQVTNDCDSTSSPFVRSKDKLLAAYVCADNGHAVRNRAPK